MNLYEMDEEAETSGPSFAERLSQLPVILAERKWFIILPALIGLIAAVAAAFLLPTRYVSEAVLLVEAPSLPEEVIGIQGDEAVAQRIESIRQQVINRPALIGLIERNQLYTDQRGTTPLSEIVEEMREEITLVPQTFEVGGGANQDQTISVNLAYTYTDPVKTQAVTQQLMERVLELDAVGSAEQQTGTVQFLSQQQEELQSRIARAESELAAFNRRYGSVMASGSLATIGGNGSAYELQISNLEREIAELESEKRVLQSADTRDPGVVQAEALLAAVRSTYSENHPDVALAKRRLEQARAVARQNVSRNPGSELDGQIRVARSQIAQLQAAKAAELSRSAAILGQRANAPVAEQQAAQLQQRVEALYKQSEEISDRLLAAQASARAGEEQMGERLLVIDPPVVPDSPESPNRPLIIAAGLLGGLLFGFALAFVLEFLSRPIRDPNALASITGERPIAIIPRLTPPKRGWFRGLRRSNS